MLAITRAAGMISVYGPDGYSQIQAKLAAYQRSVTGVNVTLAVLDDAASMEPMAAWREALTPFPCRPR